MFFVTSFLLSNLNFFSQNGRIIEKLNEDIIAKSTQLKLINEKFFDIKSSVELLENDDDCLKNVDSNLKKWQETLNN